MLEWVKEIFKAKCKHEFDIKLMERTNIPPKEKPISNDYFEWVEYYRDLYSHPSVAKRIKCKCRNCDKIFFADCGLHLPGKLVNG